MSVFTVTDLDRHKYGFYVPRLNIAIHIKIFLVYFSFLVKANIVWTFCFVVRVIPNTTEYVIASTYKEVWGSFNLNQSGLFVVFRCLFTRIVTYSYLFYLPAYNGSDFFFYEVTNTSHCLILGFLKCFRSVFFRKHLESFSLCLIKTHGWISFFKLINSMFTS